MIYLQTIDFIDTLKKHNIFETKADINDAVRQIPLNYFKMTHKEVVDEHIELLSNDFYTQRFCEVCNHLLIDQHTTPSGLFSKLQITGFSYNRLWLGKDEVSIHLIRHIIQTFPIVNPNYFFDTNQEKIYKH